MSLKKSPNKGLTPSKIVIDEVNEMTPEQLGTIVKDVEAIKKERNQLSQDVLKPAVEQGMVTQKQLLTTAKMAEHYDDVKMMEAKENLVKDVERQAKGDGTGKSKFTHDELLEALYWIHQIFERANMTMVLIRETGEAANNDRQLTGDGIYIAARKLEWDSGARGIIDSMAQFSDWTDELVTYMANNGVPVYVKVCEDDYCISSPDQKLYMHEYVKLPNPFNRFEEVYGK